MNFDMTSYSKYCDNPVMTIYISCHISSTMKADSDGRNSRLLHNMTDIFINNKQTLHNDVNILL